MPVMHVNIFSTAVAKPARKPTAKTAAAFHRESTRSQKTNKALKTLAAAKAKFQHKVLRFTHLTTLIRPRDKFLV